MDSLTGIGPNCKYLRMLISLAIIEAICGGLVFVLSIVLLYGDFQGRVLFFSTVIACCGIADGLVELIGAALGLIGLRRMIKILIDCHFVMNTLTLVIDLIVWITTVYTFEACPFENAGGVVARNFLGVTILMFLTIFMHTLCVLTSIFLCILSGHQRRPSVSSTRSADQQEINLILDPPPSYEQCILFAPGQYPSCPPPDFSSLPSIPNGEIYPSGGRENPAFVPDAESTARNNDENTFSPLSMDEARSRGFFDFLRLAGNRRWSSNAMRDDSGRDSTLDLGEAIRDCGHPSGSRESPPTRSQSDLGGGERREIANPPNDPEIRYVVSKGRVFLGKF